MDQKEAIETARTGKSYVLTTGNGSGKSFAYVIPIVDKILKAKHDGTSVMGWPMPRPAPELAWAFRE